MSKIDDLTAKILANKNYEIEDDDFKIFKN